MTEAQDCPEFITLWRRNPEMRLTLNTSTIVTVHPWTSPDGEFDGSVVKTADGEEWHVQESTMTITAKLGVEL